MVETGYTRKELLKWIKSGTSSNSYVDKYLKHGAVAPRDTEWVEEEPKSESFLCPKVDKCIMDCYHKKPHAYEERFCNDIKGECGTQCVHELISDCIFFEEDFSVD